MLEPVSLDAGTGRALGRQHIFFAGTSLYFCWNRLFFLLLWALDSFFSEIVLLELAFIFCWNRLIHLLQLAYRFLLLRFLLEPSLSFVGTGKSICFNRVPEVFVAFDICWK